MSLEGFVPAVAYTEMEITEFSHILPHKGVAAFFKHPLSRFLQSCLVTHDVK